MFAAEYDFSLPEELIAQVPARPRDAARLLRPAADGRSFDDRLVRDLPDLLAPGDLVVVNDTRVIPAQLDAIRRRAGANGEARIGLTLDAPSLDGTWRALARNVRRLRAGDRLALGTDDGGAPFAASVVAVRDGGVVHLRFDRDGDALDAALARFGRLALPPYIRRDTGPTADDRRDYQTAFAARDGAVAAPTAGLHFTDGLVARLAACGIGLVSVTLHVGAGTFLPVRSARIEDHAIHAERGEVGATASEMIASTRARGGRIVAVGTTTLRVLESAADPGGAVHPFRGETQLFIRPPYRVRTADMLLTNFHLPRSTLLMLVSAFAGTALVRRVYAHAVRERYRFYSYGDACLLTRADPS